MVSLNMDLHKSSGFSHVSLFWAIKLATWIPFITSYYTCNHADDCTDWFYPHHFYAEDTPSRKRT